MINILACSRENFGLTLTLTFSNWLLLTTVTTKVVQVKQRVRETCYLYDGGDTADYIINCK